MNKQYDCPMNNNSSFHLRYERILKDSQKTNKPNKTYETINTARPYVKKTSIMITTEYSTL